MEVLAASFPLIRRGCEDNQGAWRGRKTGGMKYEKVRERARRRKDSDEGRKEENRKAKDRLAFSSDGIWRKCEVTVEKYKRRKEVKISV